jgi:glycerophosphoryl diester phosphodiesterase
MPVRLKDQIEAWGYQAADWFFARWPQPIPSYTQLNASRLVAHRGEFDNCRVFENTFPAFDAAVQAGLWGIEFDIRWTADLTPVIHHDADLIRLYDDPAYIRDLRFDELRTRHPQIPTFAEMVHRYGGQCHLMIELKEEFYPDPDGQGRRLSRILAALTPKKDYHLLSFDPALFDALIIEPADMFIPIARLNARELAQRAVAGGYAGIGGHYLLIGSRSLASYQRQGLQVAIGFTNSTNSLFREVNRRVDWLFSDRPVKMQQTLDQLRRKGWKAGKR